jgi:tetratricopeptide (TPR) repeat protein
VHAPIRFRPLALRMLGTLLPLLLVAAAPVRSAGTPGSDEDIVGADRSVDQAALDYYAEGLHHKEVAIGLERQAADVPEADRAALLDRARASYRKAATAQGKALKLKLDYYQAANELGYALRRSGSPHKAIGAYNLALSIKPDFLEAIEYRGEAYLALGSFSAAQDAYMTLFRGDPALAARLLGAMQSVADAPPEFQAWVAERRELAELTGLTTEPAGDWREPVTPPGAGGRP